jgi:N-alpha-acetyltransferase 50
MSSDTRYTLTPLTPPLLPQYKRLNSLLLPIKYPDKFYDEPIRDPTGVGCLCFVVVWHDEPSRSKKAGETAPEPQSSWRAEARRQSENGDGGVGVREGVRGRVVGGIRCRMETVSEEEPAFEAGGDIERAQTGKAEGGSWQTLIAPTPMNSKDDGVDVGLAGSRRRRIYVMSLCLLAPYRGFGIASQLLDAVVANACLAPSPAADGPLHIYAHVHAPNLLALEFYQKRGFVLDETVIEGYYPRLRPRDARLVWKRVNPGEVIRGMALVQGSKTEIGSS